MKKALLVGNGFTSQIIHEYSSNVLVNKVWKLIPNEMAKLERLFEPFRIENLPSSPYYYFVEPSYIDSEDSNMVYTPSYNKELFSPYLRSKICQILINEYNISNPEHICQKLFIDAGLYYEMRNISIVGIETPLKIAQIGIKAGIITKQEFQIIESAIKKVLFNNGNFHLITKEYSLDTTNIDISKAKKCFNVFSTIFTTNYDLLIDDLVHDKVKHLHGGFCFLSPYKKDFKHIDPNLYEIVMASDGYEKSKQIYKTQDTLFSKYLNSLSTEDFDELHIFGYSGENDMHINNAIRNNTKIKRVYVYVNKDNINNPELLFHYGTLYRQNPNEIITPLTPHGISLLPWNLFWDQIK